MAELVWDEAGKHLYETGVSNGVLYLQNADGSYGDGVVWNGLISVSESPSGAEATPLYANNTKYLNLVSNEEFSATVEAYTYPDEFAQCDGSADLGNIAGAIRIGQQDRKSFGMVYKTILGNDVASNGYGYKIHIIYGCTAAPSEKAYSTVNDSPEAITFSWEINTVPVKVTGHKPTASLVIDSTKFTDTNKAKLAKIEAALFGSSTEDAKLPTPDEILALIAN